jgi:hypothetical protein
LKTIEVIITANGQTRIETNGYTGSDCREASRFLEKALGRSTAEQLKPEYHQAVTEHQQRARE